MRKIVIASAFLLSISATQAEEAVRWDKASLSYLSADIDGNRFTGYGASGSKLIGESFFIAGSYSAVSDDIGIAGSKADLDVNTFSIGLGYRYAISNSTDFFGVVAYHDKEVKAPGQVFSVDESYSGYGLQAGVRSLVTDNIELSGSLNYVNLDVESKGGFNVSAMYHFTSVFSAGIGYEQVDNIDSLSLSAVFFF